jgi:hypothetical protein
MASDGPGRKCIKKRQVSKSMRFIFQLFLVSAIALVAYGQNSNDWSKRISNKTKYPLSYWISSCGSPNQILFVDGNRFEHLRGSKPFYLEIPKINSIVFTSEQKDDTVVCHIYNMGTKTDSVIEIGTTFGQTIGSPHPKDNVDVATNGLVALCNYTTDAKPVTPENSNIFSIKTIELINLDQKIITERKTSFYDKTGNLIREDDWPKK